jgi:hypothetical protein
MTREQAKAFAETFGKRLAPSVSTWSQGIGQSPITVRVAMANITRKNTVAIVRLKRLAPSPPPPPAPMQGGRTERDELYDYVNGLLGLLQILRDRDDVPNNVKKIMRTNHRATDAAAYLTQILPPALIAEKDGAK